MSAPGFAKQCGVCHAGGGQMEYDRNMQDYGDTASNDLGAKYTYRVPYLGVGPTFAGIAGAIVTTSTTTELRGANKVEVDCMMCHMKEVNNGAAWYQTEGCGPAKLIGPADNANCNGFYDQPFQPGVDGPNADTRFTYTAGTIYDSFNRNIATSLGFFQQAASAGIGAVINKTSGALTSVPLSIPGTVIEYTPNSANCAQCHARTSYDVKDRPSIGLPSEAAAYGGMTTGFGNFFRLAAANTAFDFDKITNLGACTSNCGNATLWNEFGCKTGMGKRAQRAGTGDQDRFQFGICFGCAAMNYMTGQTPGWYGGGVCNLQSVKDSCNAKAGADLQTAWNAIFDMTGQGKKIAGKMPDVDPHDAIGVKCATCHYSVSGTVGPRTISGNTKSYTYPARTVNKIDHQTAQGFSLLEKANEVMDGTVTCEGCHIEGTHPNRIFTDSTGTLHAAPVPAHTGFPAVHFEKIDCRTCHIPTVYAAPGRLLVRDWTAGAYRQAEGSNGNANHFQFRYNFMDGAADPIPTMKQWLRIQKDGALVEIKIGPGLPAMLPVWVNADQGNVPLKTRDVTAAAALVSKNSGTSWGLRINGTNDHPPFQGFQLADTWKIDTATKIKAMRAELALTGAGLASHAAVANAKMNLMPFLFDPSHGVTEKEYALGAPAAGGCVMCHSSSKPCLPGDNPFTPACDAGTDPNYNAKSVGFFDGSVNMAKNGMNLLADYDCGGTDAPSSYGTNTVGAGGYSNAGNMCAYFDNPVAGPGSVVGTCDSAELMACRQNIGGMIFQMFGMPADLATTGGFAVDGVNMMQLMAVREGAMTHAPKGCDTRMLFFGLPDGTTAGTTGCAAADYYSRDEIRQHYQKNLQQVVSGDRKVFGNLKTGQTLTTYDIGNNCYNPSTGMPVTCVDGSYINTTIDQVTLLGYQPSELEVLKSLFTMSTPSTPVARFSYTVAGKVATFNGAASTPNTGLNAIYQYDWDFGDSASSIITTYAPISSATWTYSLPGTYLVSLNVKAPGGTNVKLSQVVILGNTNTPPVAVGSAVASGMTVTVTDASTDVDTTDTLRVLVNWGDGTFSNTVQNGQVAHTYAVSGKYTVYLHVADQRGGTSTRVVGIASAPYDPISITQASASISGIVTNVSGTGLNNAVVTLLTTTDLPVQAVYTSPSGTYKLEGIAAGTYKVNAALNGFYFQTVSGITVTASQQLTGVNFSAAAVRSITGNIANAPVQGVLVNLCTDSTCAVVMGVDLAYPSLNNGRFVFNGIPSGTYVIDPEGFNSTTPDLVTGVTVTAIDVVLSSPTFTYRW